MVIFQNIYSVNILFKLPQIECTGGVLTLVFITLSIKKKDGGGERVKKKILISSLTLLFALSMVTLTVSASLESHAAVEGLGIVKVGRGRPTFDRNAVITFIKVTDGYHGFTEPGWAVTLEVGEITYVWHVTSLRTCGKSSVVIIKAEPHGAVLPGLTQAPSNLRIILNHDLDRPFVVATGKGITFIGKTLV